MAKIKICGLFRDEDIDYVNEALPDFIGFVFSPRSKRYVSPQKAAQLKSRLNPKIKAVGVFTDTDKDFILRLVKSGIIDFIQLHSDEDEAYISCLKLHTSAPVIKAVSFKDSKSAELWNHSRADYILLDNGSGGTGKSFDWNKIGAFDKPFFLAGGINESNIDIAIKINPFCIDISSGAETNGVKNKEKILNIVKKIRGV